MEILALIKLIRLLVTAKLLCILAVPATTANVLWFVI